jgi:hypothetical protein
MRRSGTAGPGAVRRRRRSSSVGHAPNAAPPKRNAQHLYEAQTERTADTSDAGEGVAALGPDSPGGQRLARMRDFFEFLHGELGDLLAKWRADNPLDH